MIMASQIAGNWTVCSIACSDCKKESRKYPLYLGLCEWNLQRPSAFPNKGQWCAKIFRVISYSYIVRQKHVLISKCVHGNVLIWHQCVLCIDFSPCSFSTSCVCLPPCFHMLSLLCVTWLRINYVIFSLLDTNWSLTVLSHYILGDVAVILKV